VRFFLSMAVSHPRLCKADASFAES